MNPTNEASNQEDIISWLSLQVKYKNCEITGCAAIFTNDKIANRLYFVAFNGTCHTYDKNNLFLHAREGKKSCSCNERKIINYKSFDILLNVCFDMLFPVFNFNANDYDILLNVAC